MPIKISIPEVRLHVLNENCIIKILKLHFKFLHYTKNFHFRTRYKLLHFHNFDKWLGKIFNSFLAAITLEMTCQSSIIESVKNEHFNNEYFDKNKKNVHFNGIFEKLG